MDLKEMGRNDGDWIQLFQEKDEMADCHKHSYKIFGSTSCRNCLIGRGNAIF